ncbi:MAG: hypothetical protein K6T72_14385 [Anoxybacillus sp.]|nr:hypothetical protein [Anoxybacillus sp.]MCL6587673.1 hypothetical protein [Anoxybacillus sp.]
MEKKVVKSFRLSPDVLKMIDDIVMFYERDGIRVTSTSVVEKAISDFYDFYFSERFSVSDQIYDKNL